MGFTCVRDGMEETKRKDSKRVRWEIFLEFGGLNSLVDFLNIITMQQTEEQNQVAGFISKTFEILNNNQFNKIVYWGPQGDEFIIKDNSRFQHIVLPKYFRHNKMNSFIRQLNMYGFHKSRRQNTRSVFSHPLFRKDREDLLIQIKRRHKINRDGTPTKPTEPLSPKELQMTAIKEFREMEIENEEHFRNMQQKEFYGFHDTQLLAKSFTHLNIGMKWAPTSLLDLEMFEEPKVAKDEEITTEKIYQAPSLFFLSSVDPVSKEQEKKEFDYFSTLSRRMRETEQDKIGFTPYVSVIKVFKQIQ